MRRSDFRSGRRHIGTMRSRCDSGIIHRNITLTDGGRMTFFFFGLAKPVRPEVVSEDAGAGSTLPAAAGFSHQISA